MGLEPIDRVRVAEAQPIAVIGAGSWGTALAILLARNGQPTGLWSWDPEHVAAMRTARCNEAFLSGHTFPAGLAPTEDLAALVFGVRDVLLAVPSHAFRDVLERLASSLRKEARLAWATKGFEPGTGLLLHEVVQQVLVRRVPMGAISGPTFAGEVARGLPTAVTVATTDAPFAAGLTQRFHSERFRVYTSEDIVGVQVGGAVKNVLAIAAGIADGLGFGANTRAALITRGLAEIIRLGVALGGERETLMGLAGLGDLVLTCTDDQSRNRRLGLALGGGQSVEQALQSIGQVVEGVHTTAEVVRLARNLAIEMPITYQVHRVLSRLCSPRKAVDALLARESKKESI